MTSNKKVFNVTKANIELINKYIDYHTSIKPNLRPKSIYNIKETLKKLADHLKEKSLKEATEQDLMQFFKQIKHPTSRQIYAVNIIPFYRYIHHTSKRNRPPNMEWFEYPTQQEKRRTKNPNLKEELLITDKEYQQMIEYSNDIYGQNKAIWEIYYLTGIRPSELTPIKIKDINNKNGTTLITIPHLKSEPRTIPFQEPPYRLLEYLKQHPEQNNPESPLIFSLKNTKKLQHLRDEEPIRTRFTKMKKGLNLKSTLVLKSFRKTRTSIVFHQNKLNDKDIGKIFGWKPNTVIQRREEYELSDINDLIEKYCSKETHSIPSYTQLKKQKDTDINKMQKQIREFQEQMKDLSQWIKNQTLQGIPYEERHTIETDSHKYINGKRIDYKWNKEFTKLEQVDEEIQKEINKYYKDEIKYELEYIRLEKKYPNLSPPELDNLISVARKLGF